jgi:hypothetical protein
MATATATKLKPVPAQEPDSAPFLPERLFRLPHAVLTAAIRREYSPVELDVSHLFADGVVARVLRLPAGSLATARRHLRSHLCVLLEGSVTVWEDGGEPRVLDAPAFFVTPADSQLAGYVHENLVWLTFLPNPEGETDPEKLLDANMTLPPEPDGAVPILRELFGEEAG